MNDPNRGVFPCVASFESLKNIYKPTTTNPKFPKVLAGSLKNPLLTRSHHLEISPIACSFSAEGTEASIDDDLVRISVGLENTEDLISDLESALNAAKK